MEKIYACLHRPTGRERMEFAYFYNPEDQGIYISENGAEPKKHPVTSIGWRRILSARGYEKIHEASRHILDYLNAKLGAK